MHYPLRSTLALIVITLLANLAIYAQCIGDPVFLTFDFDSCNATGTVASSDYSEFTPTITESEGVRLELLNSSLYRLDPTQNRHSCTPGRNGTPALCVSAYDYCSYQPGITPSVRIDFRLSPLTNESARLKSFCFYQKAPNNFEWINGITGINNFPRHYGIRIRKEGEIVYEQSDFTTTTDWSIETFNFSDNDLFKVRTATSFSIELLAYCPVGLFAPYSIWDLEDVKIEATCELNCNDIAEGGLIATDTGLTEVSLCEDAALIYLTTTSRTSPANYWYLLVDTNDNIISATRSEAITAYSFENIPAGNYRIYGVSLATEQTPTVGSNLDLLIQDPTCELLSDNFIAVDRSLVQPGTLEGGPFEFCVGDGISDFIPNGSISLTGAVGESELWVVTDPSGTTILDLPNSPYEVDFETFPGDRCLLWHLSYTGILEQVEVGGAFTCIIGCMKRSNSLTIIKRRNNGGTIEGAPVAVCLTEDVPTYIPSTLTLSGAAGENSRWVLTNSTGQILYLANNYQDIDLSPYQAGNYNLTHISYARPIAGLMVNSTLSSLSGCYSTSNSIAVSLDLAYGGEISGGPFILCVGDGVPDYIPTDAITLTGSRGTFGQWVVTDVMGIEILAILDSPYDFDFDGAGTGSCDLWHVAYNERPVGLTIGGNFSELHGCSGKSNFIEIVRVQNSPAVLAGGPFEFCISDGEPDFIPAAAINVTPGIGSNDLWVVTDMNNNLVGFPANFDSFDFDLGSGGNYNLYHLTYDGQLTGLTNGAALNSIGGCYTLSNPINITRNNCRPPLNGGVLGGGPFTFCNDGQPDFTTTLTLMNTFGDLKQWVITDQQNTILDLPADIYVTDFETLTGDNLIIYNLSSDEPVMGLVVGNNLTSLSGDYSLSNGVQVNKGRPSGGVLTGGPFEFCVGNGVPDLLTLDNLSLSGNTGVNSSYVITDATGTTIVAIVNDTKDFNFDLSGFEANLLWHLSYEGVPAGLEVGGLVSNINGCFGLSNSLTINKNPMTGGSIAGGPFYFCVDDGIADMIPANSVSLTGNSGSNNQWVVTDVGGRTILELPSNLEDKDYENELPGNCTLWNVTYDGPAPNNLVVGGDFTDLGHCSAKSNFISLNKVENNGGFIISNPIEFCVGDGIADTIPEGFITLTGNTGTNSQWVVTDMDGIILNLPLFSYSNVDLDNFGPGGCQLIHMSYDGPLTNFMMGQPINAIGGCYQLSNSLPIIKNDCGTNLSELIISSVGSDGRVELKNISDSTLDLNAYELVNGDLRNSVGELKNLCDSNFSLEPAATMQLQSDLDLSAEAGELALYRKLGTDSELIHYVTWGTPDNNCTEQAIELGLWKEEYKIPEIKVGKALVFDGEGLSSDSWYEGEQVSCLSNTENEALLFSLYPNPVRDQLYLELNPAGESVHLNVIDPTGKVHVQRTLNSNESEHQIDMSQLPVGLYYLEITNSKQNKVLSLIKI